MLVSWYFLFLKFNSFLTATVRSTCERYCHSNEKYKKEQKPVPEYSYVWSPRHWKDALCQGKPCQDSDKVYVAEGSENYEVLSTLCGLKSIT